ncbi:MAG: BadF/BadG/BcrA/BcrD ATPase family protein [Planctomycetota bacterium]
MQSDRLVLGIDGGATKTVAWLALCDSEGKPSVVGRGMAGPANPQATGFPEALRNLDQAIAAALNEAGAKPGPLAAAVLALAGSDRDENRQVLHRWAEKRRLARRFRVVHDALPVLVAGSPEGWGVALIAGTGSLAFGQTRDGQTTRAGGWGFLFGDEGGGYAIALAGLQAAAKSADGRAPATQLLAALLERLDLKEPQQLIPAVYRMAADRAKIASLADAVTTTADQGDATAQRILDDAANELATMVAAVAQKLGFSGDPFPLALAGGVLLGSQRLRAGLENHVNSLGLRPKPIAVVKDPVAGAVKLAQAEALIE